MQQQVISQMFDQSYAIFISKKDVKVCDEYIKTNQLKEKSGVVVIASADKEKDLCCVVIPTTENYMKIEKDLFKLKEWEGGFWGQVGVGYKNETWIEIS